MLVIIITSLNVYCAPVYLYLVLLADYLRGRQGPSFHLCRSPQTGSGPPRHQMCLLYCRKALRTGTRRHNNSGTKYLGKVKPGLIKARRLIYLSDRSPWRSCIAESCTAPRRQTSCTMSAWRIGCPCSCCEPSCTWRKRESRSVLHLWSDRDRASCCSWKISIL